MLKGSAVAAVALVAAGAMVRFAPGGAEFAAPPVAVTAAGFSCPPREGRPGVAPETPGGVGQPASVADPAPHGRSGRCAGDDVIVRIELTCGAASSR